MSIIANLRALFIGRPAPEEPTPLPPGKTRIHLLIGMFEDESAARRYCYSGGGNTPEQLTVEQPGAFIDTTHVEVSFGDHTELLTKYLGTSQKTGMFEKVNQANTLIVISEPAFAGMPYRLDHTKTLRYAGAFVVSL
jgi:hypothetical protein